jgi:sphingomyelin phosphodiesterase 2
MALRNGRIGADTDFQSSALLQHPPEALTKEITLKLVTFNIQDTWVVGQDRPERMRGIGATLTALDPDIVGFQEAFIPADRAVLMAALKDSRLKHFQYFRSGTVGCGLFVASAYPIAEAYFHRFSVAGDWYKIWEGDWWAGKGVALARIQLPGGGLFDFYDTHAQAGYGNAQYNVVRKGQMTELGTFVTASRMRTVPAFLVGDMNCRPGAEDFGAAVFGANLLRVKNLDTHIDHIFTVKDPHYDVEVLDTVKIDEQTEAKGRRVDLSDHKGYMSTVRIRPRP